MTETFQLFVGIDWATEAHQVCALNSHGEVLGEHRWRDRISALRCGRRNAAGGRGLGAVAEFPAALPNHGSPVVRACILVATLHRGGAGKRLRRRS